MSSHPTANSEVVDLDPLAPANLGNPYPRYRMLRDRFPVYRHESSDYFVVSRYEDIAALAMNTNEYSSNLVAILLAGGDGRATTFDAASTGMNPVDVLAIADPPAHGRQRKITQGALSTRFFRGLEDEIRPRARSFLEPLLRRGQGEWMHELAFRLPMTIALTMVGFPEKDWADMKSWCDHGVALLNGVNTPDELALHGMYAGRAIEYVRERFEEAEGTVADNLTGTLVEAVREGSVSAAEAVSILFQILIAGNDSSASTIGSAVRVLADDPGLQVRLRSDPARIPDFIEEVLRLESPFQGHFRVTREDCTLHGLDLPKGTRLMVLWASGNRDEREFADPERLNLDRPNAKSHLAFGWGIHHCLGAPLARMEVRIVLEELLARTRRISRTDAPLDYLPSVFVRTLRTLPVVLE